jgi:hypothetical protein
VSTSSEIASTNSFLPIFPLQVKVLPLTSVESTLPTLDIGDIKVNSIGYPLRVPISLSAGAANTLYLAINVVETSVFGKIIEINPSVITIPPETLSSYFEITITAKRVPAVFASIQFSLTSYYTVVHTVTTPIKYISFHLTRSKSLNYALLAVTFDNNGLKTPLDDAKAPVSVMDSSVAIKQLVPKIIKFKVDK